MFLSRGSANCTPRMQPASLQVVPGGTPSARGTFFLLSLFPHDIFIQKVLPRIHYKWQTSLSCEYRLLALLARPTAAAVRNFRRF